MDESVKSPVKIKLIVIFCVLAVLAVGSLGAIIFFAIHNNSIGEFRNCDGSAMVTEELIECIDEQYGGNKEEQIAAYDKSINRAKDANDETEAINLIRKRAAVITEAKGCDAGLASYKENLEGLSDVALRVIYQNAAVSSRDCDDSATEQEFLKLMNDVKEENEKSF